MLSNDIGAPLNLLDLKVGERRNFTRLRIDIDCAHDAEQPQTRQAEADRKLPNGLLKRDKDAVAGAKGNANLKPQIGTGRSPCSHFVHDSKRLAGLKKIFSHCLSNLSKIRLNPLVLPLVLYVASGCTTTFPATPSPHRTLTLE